MLHLAHAKLPASRKNNVYSDNMTARQPTHNSETILLVDDDPDAVTLARRALKKTGTSTLMVSAETVTDVFQRLADAETLPALILLDLKLHDGTGFDVLKRLRADPRTAGIPVIMLTSSDEPSDLRESYRLGANAYVCKPVDFDEFVAVMRDLQQFWLRHNRLPETMEACP